MTPITEPVPADLTNPSGNTRSSLFPMMLAAALLAIIAFAAPATAGPITKAKDFTKADRADIKRVEAYMNRLKSVKSKFLQLSSNGAFAEGQLYILRPGRMRIDYDAPVPIEIVADGEWLIYHDKELEQVSYVGLDQTPAGILIRKNVSLSGELAVTSIERDPGVLRISVGRSADLEEGTLTLVFSIKPMVLRKWSTVDAQGLLTTVALQNARFGIKVDPKLFEFTDPYRERNEAREAEQH